MIRAHHLIILALVGALVYVAMKKKKATGKYGL